MELLLSLLIIKFPFHEYSGTRTLTCFSFGINCHLEVSESLRAAKEALDNRMLIPQEETPL